MSQRIPGPPGHFLTGNLSAMRQNFLQLLVDTARDYGAVARLRAGPTSMLLISNPDDIADVLVHRAHLFHKTRSTKRLLNVLLGDGLISREGEAHRQHRIIMQPAFHTRQVQQYMQVVVNRVNTWLQQRSDGEVLNIVPAIADLMLSIVVETFFSASLTETGQMRTALSSFSKALDLRVRSAVPLPQWLPTEHNRMLRQTLNTLDTAVYGLIAERRKQANPPVDLLTMLLTAHHEETEQPLSDQEIRDEIATIFFAGYETTTTTLSWICYLLATHPAVLAKLHTEITEVLQGSLPDATKLQQMSYLDQVIKEVLRLYPPAWLFDREPIEATTLGGYSISAGQTLFISPYLVHRNPAYFESPDEFRPERFRNGVDKNLPRFGYFPFGGGARICIGQPFALHTISFILATLIPRLQLEVLSDQNIRPAAAATLVPAGGIQMRVHRL